ncbi:cilia- and flagella-associated protein 206 [Brienomyrus brachyistius]|uniref:cilia- and flagella-associated protein 206 n=1 Tax=Brienomyrus brachyistius TaxID=42636 RepID=UPI0020B1CB14|nr:cilia- and flagella-associated protein 206 [Brienomyrus brachyistius]
MSYPPAGNIIKSIIREVVKECLAKGQSISETLATFMVKAVVLDPQNQFNVDRTITKQDVQEVIERCVQRLLDLQSPSVDTIKMQAYFDMHYTSRQEYLKEHRRVLQAQLIPITREITDSRAKSRDELETLYGKIASYVLLRSGMGSPTDISTVREAAAALHSVFPQPELGVFIPLSRKDKEQQLELLSRLVTGIRLFNRDRRKGGDSIDDLPAILNESISTSIEHIKFEAGASQNLAYRYIALLEGLQATELVLKDGNVPPKFLKEALYNARQHETFLRLILADVRVCEEQTRSLQSELHSQMEELKIIVHSKTAVPTAQVFPHFTALAKLWSGLQDEMHLLSILNSMVANLQPFLGAQSWQLPKDQLEIFLEGVEVKTDEQRMKESADNRIDPSVFKNQEWLFPETTVNMDTLPFQHKGMCANALIKHGLLLPGNPAVGILKHRNKYHIFSSKKAACEFASNPDESIESVAEEAKSSPELIQLLELHLQFSPVTPYPEMGKKHLTQPVAKCDGDTQTDTHPVESNIVKSYKWNEWELRRQAVKLANLRTKVTCSMQTNLSHMRRDNATQTYTPKEAACQTKKDGESSVPRPRGYLAGLRGGQSRTTRLIKTNLTRPVDE